MQESLGHKWWRPPPFGWKYLNYILIGVAVVVGFGSWLMPNNWNEPEYQAALEKYRKAGEYRRALAAEEAKHKAMVEELGLIYIEPGADPFVPPMPKPGN